MFDNTIAAQMWFTNFQDVLQANTVIMQAATSMQKSQFDNWEIQAKTQYGILGKQNNLVLDFANKQDGLFKSWEKYVSGEGK